MNEHRHDRVDALNLRDDLLWIADAWPDLVARLGRETTRRAADGSPRAASRSVGLVIDEAVSELIRAVTDWTAFLAHVLVDETDWTPPPGADTPALLVAVAARVGHFTAHRDPMLRLAVLDEAREHRRAVVRAAYPDGIRTIHLAAWPCPETVTVSGTEVPCIGHMTLRPLVSGDMPDMVCSADRDHRLAPARWRALVARRINHEAAARELLAAIVAA